MNISAQSGSSASFYNASPFACYVQQNSDVESRVNNSNPKTSADNASESFCSQQEKSSAASCKFSAPPTMPLPISASKVEQVAEASPTARFPHSKSEDKEVVTQSTTESPLSLPFAAAFVVPPAREQGEVDRRGKPLPSSLTIKVRAIILGWKAGTLIGRQGLVISNLRNESRCKITISDALAASDRILTIVGPSAQVALVLRRVCHLLSGVCTTGASLTLSDHDGVSAQITPQAQRGAALHLEDSSDAAHLRSSNSVTENPFLNFSLAVPSPLCGCLIGRGGSQIREFRQTYSVNFVVASTSIEDTHDRLVTVSGPTTNVADCLQDVCRIFASVIPGGARRRVGNDRCAPPDSDAHEMQGNAVVVQPGWRRDGATDVPRFPRFRSTSPVSFAESGKKNVAKSQRALSQKAKVKSATQNQTTAAHDDGRCAENHEMLCTAPRGDGPSAGGATSSGDTTHRFPDCCACEAAYSTDHVQTNNQSNTIVECSFTLKSGETEVYLLVPNDIVGCIIGKGGKTISEIRDTSATFISITESSFPPVPPRNAISTDSYPSRTAVQRIVANGMRPGARRRDRVICIRGALQSVRTARFLMGSSILNAQTANSSGAECLLSGPCGGAATASASMKALPVGSGKA